MSLVDNLLNHPDPLDFYSVTKDKYGDNTRTLVYSNVRCRWNEKKTVVVSRSGEELVSTIIVWILPEYTIEEDYEIIKNNKLYKIASVSDKYDIFGVKDHVKIYLK